MNVTDDETVTSLLQATRLDLTGKQNKRRWESWTRLSSSVDATLRLSKYSLPVDSRPSEPWLILLILSLSLFLFRDTFTLPLSLAHLLSQTIPRGVRHELPQATATKYYRNSGYFYATILMCKTHNMHIPTEKEKENEPKSNFSFVFRLVSLQNVKRKQEGARDETGERKREQKKNLLQFSLLFSDSFRISIGIFPPSATPTPA